VPIPLLKFMGSLTHILWRYPEFLPMIKDAKPNSSPDLSSADKMYLFLS